MHLFKFHVSLESDNFHSGDDALDELYRLMAQPNEDLGFDYTIEGYEYLGTFDSPSHVYEVLIGAEDLDAANEVMESQLFAETKPGLVVKYAIV